MNQALKKVLLIAFATVASFAIQSPAVASQVCVPTKSVEAAKADYDSGLAILNVQLEQAYSAAHLEYSQSNADALARHDSNMFSSNARYNQEAKDIQANLNNGWRELLEAAATRHNLEIKQISDQYSSDTQANSSRYNQRTAEAQANFNFGVQALITEYNQTVCAGR